MPPTAPVITEPTLLERLQASRQAVIEKWQGEIDAREKVEADFEARQASDAKPTADEITAHSDTRVSFRASVDLLDAEVKDYDQRIADQREVERRRTEAAKANEGKGGGIVRSEPMTYERYKAVGEYGVSYYRDLAAAFVQGATFESTTREDALARVQQHSKEMAIELPKREAKARQSAERQLIEAETESRGGTVNFDPFKRMGLDTRGSARGLPTRANPNPQEMRVEPNLTQGQGGYFVPPLWLVDQFIPGLRAHRIAVGLARQMDLPPGTDSINIPKLSTLTTVGYQQANNAGLPSQDWTDTSVQANVKTVGGYTDVALQLLEQSPHQIVDEVVTTDMHAAYDLFVDQQFLTGDGVNASQLNGGHLVGLYPSTNWASTNTVTYTNSSAQPYSFPIVLGAMASQIGKTRYSVEGLKFVVHGRRAMWYLTGQDGNDRPLGETMAGGRYNIAAAEANGIQVEGLMATLPFLFDTPLYADYNVPTNDAGSGTGTGGSDDVAIGALFDDVWFFSGQLRTNIYQEILSATLGIRFQLYNYHAMLVRYGQSLCIASGTGFGAPAGPSGYTSVLF